MDLVICSDSKAGYWPSMEKSLLPASYIWCILLIFQPRKDIVRVGKIIARIPWSSLVLPVSSTAYIPSNVAHWETVKQNEWAVCFSVQKTFPILRREKSLIIFLYFPPFFLTCCRFSAIIIWEGFKHLELYFQYYRCPREIYFYRSGQSTIFHSESHHFLEVTSFSEKCFCTTCCYWKHCSCS